MVQAAARTDIQAEVVIELNSAVGAESGAEVGTGFRSETGREGRASGTEAEDDMVATEEEVGIRCFTNQCAGFRGVLKQRWAPCVLWG